MCKKAKCAYLKKDGICMVYKKPCSILHPEARCREGVARADHKVQEHFWECVKEWNFKTAKGRFSFYTRKTTKYKVYRTCSRKKRFANLYAAKQKAKDLRRKNGLELLAYECPFCGGYHLTHQRRRNLEILNGYEFLEKETVRNEEYV